MATALYLAGKITGDPDFIEKFARAQARLEAKDFIVFNPAKLPQDAFSWDAYMRIGFALLDECDVICMLPDWRESNGATWELGRAIAKGKRIIYYEDIVHVDEDGALSSAAQTTGN